MIFTNKTIHRYSRTSWYFIIWQYVKQRRLIFSFFFLWIIDFYIGSNLSYKQKIDWNTDICFFNSLLSLFSIIYTIKHAARHHWAVSIVVFFRVWIVGAVFAPSPFGNRTEAGYSCKSGYQYCVGNPILFNKKNGEILKDISTISVTHLKQFKTLKFNRYVMSC